MTNKKIPLLMTGVILCGILFNLYSLGGSPLRTVHYQGKTPHPNLDYTPFKPFIQGYTTVGYFTDSSLTFLESHRILKAQSALAPTVLDVSTTKHDLRILDCGNPTLCHIKLHNENGTPIISINHTILEKRP